MLDFQFSLHFVLYVDFLCCFMPENHNKMMIMLAYIFLLSDKALSFSSEALEVVSTKESRGQIWLDP